MHSFKKMKVSLLQLLALSMLLIFAVPVQAATSAEIHKAQEMSRYTAGFARLLGEAVAYAPADHVIAMFCEGEILEGTLPILTFYVNDLRIPGTDLRALAIEYASLAYEACQVPVDVGKNSL